MMTWAPREGSRRGLTEVARGDKGLDGGGGDGDRGRQWGIVAARVHELYRLERSFDLGIDLSGRHGATGGMSHAEMTGAGRIGVWCRCGVGGGRSHAETTDTGRSSGGGVSRE
jgi:hypothetical protein